MPKPKVIFADEALPRFKQGWDSIANTLAVTLGPCAGFVLLTKEGRPNETERLVDGATIARRIIEIPGRAENVGAMLMRHMAWRMHEEIGDGCATMAVLAQRILEEGYRCIVAGANPMMLRRGIEIATKVALEALQKMAQPIEGEEHLAQMATALTGDPELGKILGEMLDTLGADGAVIVEEYMGPYLDRQYVDGTRYDGGYASFHFVTDPVRREAVLEAPRILITDQDVQRVEQILPLLEQLANNNKTPFVVIGREVKGTALATLVLNHQRKVLPCLGINYKAYLARMDHLQDMALMTGARVLTKEAEYRLEDATLADLGSARRVIAQSDQFMIVGGGGDREAIRKRIREVRARLAIAQDEQEKETLRKRLGNLTGGIGILRFGTFSEEERKLKREEIDRVLKVLSAAAEEGIVPGGGVAYLECIPAVRKLEAEGDVAAGVNAVARALEAPMRRIIENAGFHPPLIIADAQQHGPGYGYDVLAEKIVHMKEAGIMDSVRVLRTALATASSGACMALTAGAIVLHRKPQESFTP